MTHESADVKADFRGAPSDAPKAPTMFCLACGYVLDGLPAPRCPECGRVFDPRDPRSYRRPRAQSEPTGRILLRSGLTFASGAAVGMLAFNCWLDMIGSTAVLVGVCVAFAIGVLAGAHERHWEGCVRMAAALSVGVVIGPIIQCMYQIAIPAHLEAEDWLIPFTSVTCEEVAVLLGLLGLFGWALAILACGLGMRLKRGARA